MKVRLILATLAMISCSLIFPAVTMAADWDYGMNEVGGWDSWGYDTGGWDSWGYDTNNWDSWGYDTGGWDSWGYDTNNWDSWGYDSEWGTSPQYTDVPAPEYWDVAAPEYWDVAAPEYWDVAAPEYSYYSPQYYDTVTEEYFYNGGYHSTPLTIAPPRYTPPVYTPPRQQPPVVITQPSQPNVTNTNVTTNTCTNNSCNTNIDNSIHGSFNTSNVATVVPITPQPIAQYTFPYQYPQQQGLYCLISASQTSISAGQTTYLAWSTSYNATSATLSEFGSVPTSGTRAVNPFSTRTYVLTVYGPTGTNSCSVTVNVHAQAPYVSLSQIPYTGLDLGLFGNIMYWMGMLGIAAAAAYLFVYYKGGALALATESIRGLRADLSEESTEEAAPVADEPQMSATVLDEVPVARATKDVMQTVRDADGTPRIVIARA